MYSQQQKDTFRQVCQTFSNGLRNGKAGEPRAYLASLKLDMDITGAMFASGQISHRKTTEELAPLLDIGLIKPAPVAFHRDKPAGYSSFGKYGIVWALRDHEGDVVNLYAYRFRLEKPVHEFLNQTGLYPGYPLEATQRLYICIDVISTATLIQSGLMDNREATIALMDGRLFPQHLDVLSSQALRTVTLIGCPSSIADTISRQFPDLNIETVNLPEGETFNSIWVAQGQAGIQSLLPTNATVPQTDTAGAGLRQIHPHKLLYEGESGQYYVQGEIGMELSSLMVTLKIHFAPGIVIAGKYDLYNISDRNSIAKNAQEHDVPPHLVESDLMFLLLALDTLRDERLAAGPSARQRIQPAISHTRQMELQQFLVAPDLMTNINRKLGEAGIIGEETTRLAIFIIAASFQHSNPLHLILQGSSGSGKSFLLNTIAACIPEDSVLSLTKTSAMSLYYLRDEDISNRLVVVQDLDGLHEDALYALRELQSAGVIANLRPHKDRRTGDIRTSNTEVRASFASLAATTSGSTHFDNVSRSIVLGIEETPEQTRAIVERQNRLRAGIMDTRTEDEAKLFLCQLHALLKSYPVLIPFAHQLSIPAEGIILRRLNEQFLSFVEQIALLHQHQREIDENGRLIATHEDARMAIDLFFTAIFLKTDDMDAGLRQFYEQLKRYVRTHMPANKFRQRDIRHALKYSKSHTQYFLQGLREREYIRIVGGTVNKGFIYEIDFWDDAVKVKQHIRQALLTQLEAAL